jgi:hypothetical protein
LFGVHSGLSWYPGFFELLTLVLTPFLFYGAWFCLRDARRFIVLFFPAFHLFAIAALKMGYEDRYLFPALPFGIMLAFYGAGALSARFKPLTVKNLLAVFILIETLPQHRKTQS